MQQEEELLFEIDDDARWMGELTFLVLSWVMLVLMSWYFNIGFTHFIDSVRDAPAWSSAVVSVLAAFIVIFTVSSLFNIAVSWNRRDKKIFFYADRIVMSMDNRTFPIEEVDEGFFLSMMLTGNYSRINKRTGEYRKYTISVLSPFLLPIVIVGKLASLSACCAFLLKYRQPVPLKAIFFPYLSLVNRNNERVVLVVSGPNREKVLNYLSHYLYTDPASLPKHFTALPEKSRNLEQQINARNITMTTRSLEAWEWYRGSGMNVTTEMGE